MDFQYIIKGVGIGLMMSIPLGPIGVLIIQKTIHKGKLAGFVSGMGAAVADMFYATVAAFGLGIIVKFFKDQEFYLQLIGSIFLVYIGLRIFLSNPTKQMRKARKPGKKGMLGDFLSIMFLTASNPVAVVAFLFVFTSTSVFGANPTLRIELFLILGVLLGGSLWWYSLSTLVNAFRSRFRLKQLFWINKVAGVVISILGVLSLLACFEPIRSLVGY